LRLFVDTSVWSLAFRRDKPSTTPEVEYLHHALSEGGSVFTTGLVLQELLQGFCGPRDVQTILDHFASLPMLSPTREDHIEAAALRNTCRRRGIQVGTVDAILAQLCLHHELVLLTADADFRRMTSACALSVWRK